MVGGGRFVVHFFLIFIPKNRFCFEKNECLRFENCILILKMSDT